MNLFKDKKLLAFLVKFLLSFCILYYGTIAFIGLATPGNYYISFVDNYFDYFRWLRSSLLHAAKFLLGIFGFAADILQPNYLKMSGGRGVRVGYDCLGYGVISFWMAFIFANRGSWKLKLLWMAGGAVGLWMINIARISLILIATNKRWALPFGWDNHTWFNIFAYGFIFFMIFFYDKNTKEPALIP